MTSPTEFGQVIVTNDDEGVTRQLQTCLAAHKVEHFIVHQNPQKTMEMLNEGKLADLAFFDIRMRGYEKGGFIQLIADHASKQVQLLPAVMILGRITTEESVLLQELGYEYQLGKPFSTDSFSALMEQISSDKSNEGSLRLFLSKFQQNITENKLMEAKTLLTPRFQTNTKSPHLLLCWVKLMFASNEGKRGIEFLKKILTSNPNFTPALEFAAEICIKQENENQALLFLEKAVRCSPLRVPRLLRVGEMLLKAENAPLAEERFRSILRIIPGHRETLKRLAEACKTQGKTADAEIALRMVETQNAEATK